MSEERYFMAAGSDDEEEAAPAPFFQQLHRRRAPSVYGNGANTRARAARPQMIHLPRTPPIGAALVDYGEDDEDADGEEEIGPPAPDDMPPRPRSRLAKRSREDEDDEDDVLDRLAGMNKGGAKPQPFRPEKRRKENEAAVAAAAAAAAAAVASPSPNSGPTPTSPNPGPVSDAEFVSGLIAKATKGVVTQGGGGEMGGGPKRIKLKFGAAGIAVAKAAPPAVRAEPSAKDGDTG
jgi:protein phosphatase-4 regulatory subunit 3